jgi:hypothetical protein
LSSADVSVAGNLTVTGDLRVNGNDIQSSTGATAVTLSGANVGVAGTLLTLGSTFDNELAISAESNLLDTNTLAGTSLAIQSNYWTSSAKTTRTVPQNTNKLGNFRWNSYSDTAGAYVLGAQLSVAATENFTSTANGTSISLFANKQGQSWTTGHTGVATFSPEFAVIMADTITLENSAGTDYAVLNSTSATFSQPIGFPVKTAAAWNAITGAVGQQVCVSDSPVVAGKMAYWSSTATAGWRYIDTNTAI